MKKLIYVSAFLLLGTVALSSCKKDWTCRCGDESVNEGYTIYNQTKSKAKKACEGKASIGVISVGGDSSCYIN